MAFPMNISGLKENEDKEEHLVTPCNFKGLPKYSHIGILADAMLTRTYHEAKTAVPGRHIARVIWFWEGTR